MMGYFDFGYGMGYFGFIFMILFVVGFIWLIVWFVDKNMQPFKSSKNKMHFHKPNLEILKERFAKGEISKKEYLEIKHELSK